MFVLKRYKKLMWNILIKVNIIVLLVNVELVWFGFCIIYLFFCISFEFNLIVKVEYGFEYCFKGILVLCDFFFKL